jgi:hypothetical protein
VLLANLCVDDDGTPCDPELAAQTANKSTLHVVLQVAQVSQRQCDVHCHELSADLDSHTLAQCTAAQSLAVRRPSAPLRPTLAFSTGLSTVNPYAVAVPLTIGRLLSAAAAVGVPE